MARAKPDEEKEGPKEEDIEQAGEGKATEQVDEPPRPAASEQQAAGQRDAESQ